MKSFATRYLIPAAIVSGFFQSTPMTQAAVSLASGSYLDDFNWTSSSNWTLTGLGTQTIFASGHNAKMQTAPTTSGANGMITPRASETPPTLPAEGVDPIKTPLTYSSFGFGDRWLTNTTASTAPRSAIIEFNNLGVHDSINLNFLFAVGDSIDNNEGLIELYIDDVLVFRRDANGGGLGATSSVAGSPNVGADSLFTEYVRNANLSPYYRETWNSGAVGVNERYAESWTLDAAYGLDGTFAHTADTLKIEWRITLLDQVYTDEFIALDRFQVTVIPEPSKSLLIIGSMAFMMLQRRR